jgi:cyclohexanecarboxyl-CoA dehydrogenase
LVDFNPGPEQPALVETASKFARDRLAPGYRGREKAERIEREVIREIESGTPKYTSRIAGMSVVMIETGAPRSTPDAIGAWLGL